jgi:large subunit ribosomal protein L22
MTGPKRNEGATIAGERTGTRAVARYVRVSAYKAREVLNLIRGLDVKSADEVLQFTERAVSNDIRKVLASAVANAIENDGQDAEDLYVRACFADEGPTLKRFRPRARGRAARIRKRTCHITVIVDVLTDSMQARRSTKENARAASGKGRTTSPATARRARVQRSREAASGITSAADEIVANESDAVEAVAGDEVEIQSLVSDIGVDVAESAYAGSVVADGDDAPEGFDVKGNAQSMLYHAPGTQYYKQTKAEYWFASVEAAEAAGFSAPGSQDESDEGDN